MSRSYILRIGTFLLVLLFIAQVKVIAASAPPIDAIYINETLQYNAMPVQLSVNRTFSTGDPEMVVPTTDVTWESMNPDVVTVVNGKISFTGKLGTVTIKATVDSGDPDNPFTATVSTNVTATSAIVGTLAYSTTPVQLRFENTYIDGSKRTITDAIWTSNNPAVATVNSTTGVVTFKNKQGPVAITAQAGGNTESISTTVPYHSIKINQTNLNYTAIPSSPVQLAVTGVNYDGTTESIPSGTVNWTVSPSSIASIDGTGKLTFTGMNGNATIMAQYQGNSTSVVATINVPRNLVSLTINNNAPLFFSGSPVTLSVKGNYSDGTNGSISNSLLTWSGSNSNVATVNSAGVVTFSGRNGSVTITVQSGSVWTSVSAVVNLTAGSMVIEGSGPFVYSASPVTLRAKDGVTVLSNVIWSSSDTSIATVTGGVVTFTGKNGTVTIYATYGDKTANISTTVQQNIAALVIKGTLAYTSSSLPLSVEVTWPDGRKQTMSNVSWSSSNPSVATISPTGVVNFIGNNGALTINATYANQTANLYAYIVNVNQVVDLRINQALFYSSTPVILTLNGTLADGRQQTVPSSNAVWTSSDTAIATVNNGVVTYTGRNGYLTITANYNNRTASQSIYVNSSIVLSALRIKETLGYNVSPIALSLAATLVNGQSLDVSPGEAVWTSSDTTIATVNNGIVAFTGKNGALTITVNYGNKTASVSTTVVNTISSLRINEVLNFSPNPVSLTLIGTLVNGTTQYISNAVWSTSNSSVATVNNGIVTFTGNSGIVTITANYGGRTAVVSATVAPGQLGNPFSSSVLNKTAIENNILLKVRNTPRLSAITNYKDAEQHWASREIKIAKKLGLVSGYPDNTYKPDDNVTRGEFVVMVSNMFNITPSTYNSNNFKDISSHFARGYITSLNNLGVIGGYSDRTFKPDDKITRAEVVTILSKLINFNQVPSRGSTTFYDTNGHWAANGIRQISSIGLLSGKGSGQFGPDDNTTRAEAISLLLRTLGLDSTIKTSLDAL